MSTPSSPAPVAIFGPWPFVSDLRTGAMSGGSPEQALLSAACGQMAHFYDLTGGTASGMSDSKIPDAQAGMEKGINHALVGNAGANLIYEFAGMHASLLGFCLESLVLDNDIIGAVQRTIRGIEVSEEAISVETIRDVCLNGPGHYLGSDQTLKRMQTRLCLSRGRRPAQPQRLDGARRHQRRRPRHAEDQGDPAEALSAACLPRGGRCGAGEVQGVSAAGGDAGLGTVRQVKRPSPFPSLRDGPLPLPLRGRG